jgi:hypothetical protein
MGLYIPELGKVIDYENEREYLTGIIAQGGGAKTWAKKQLDLYNRTKAEEEKIIRQREDRERKSTSSASSGATGTADLRAHENATAGQYTSYVPQESKSLNMDGMIGLGAILAVIFLLKR